MVAAARFRALGFGVAKDHQSAHAVRSAFFAAGIGHPASAIPAANRFPFAEKML